MSGALAGAVEAARRGRPPLRGAGQGQPPVPGARSRGGSCPGTAGPSSAAGSGGPAFPRQGGRDGALARSTSSEHLRTALPPPPEKGRVDGIKATSAAQIGGGGGGKK